MIIENFFPTIVYGKDVELDNKQLAQDITNWSNSLMVWKAGNQFQMGGNATIHQKFHSWLPSEFDGPYGYSGARILPPFGNATTILSPFATSLTII